MTEHWTAPARPRRVGILLNNAFVADSRTFKIAAALAGAGHRVTVVGRTADGLPEWEAHEGFDVVRLPQPVPFKWLPRRHLPRVEEPAPGAEGSGARRLQTKQMLAGTAGRGIQALRYLRLARLWARDISLAVGGVDTWQAEELVMLPVALELRRRVGGRVVYDSRDLDIHSAGFVRLPHWWRRALASRERSWARSADALISASEPYATVLEQMWGRRPMVVWNGPASFEGPDPPPRLWHQRLALEPGDRVVLYLGLLVAGRGIWRLCQAMADVPNAVLVLAGYGSGEESIRSEVVTLPHADRIRFVGPVAPDQILPLVGAADVSAMPIPGDTLNHRLNTPTKLFDAMGAGTPVVASDLPGMAPIVQETGCGVLCDPNDPADIARAIRAIIDAPRERRASYRAACLAAAQGTYAWHRQRDVLLDVYAHLGD